MRFWTALVAALACVCAVAEQVGPYDVSGKLVRVGKAASQARVVLNGGAHVAIPREDGYFSFMGLAPGVYFLETQLVGYTFEPLRLDLSAKQEKVTATRTVAKRRVSYPLVLRATPAAYFEERQPYDWMAMLKSPMGMMMGFTLLIVIVFPRILANMDPAELEQMKKMSMRDMVKGGPDSAAAAAAAVGAGNTVAGAATAKKTKKRK